MKTGESEKKGFTIIEVVLVLAVAGLIFIMVFVALPALQRSQRDNARREDMMNFIAKAKDYSLNNHGALPGSAEANTDAIINVVWSEALGATTGNTNTWRGFYRDFLGKNFLDPDGQNYKLSVMKCGMKTDESCNETSNVRVKSALDNIYETTFPNEYNILVVLQAKCEGDHVTGSPNPRELAVLYRLEGSGVYCRSMAN